MVPIVMIPDLTRLEESKRMAEKYHAAFEYNDFFLPEVYRDPVETERRIQAYKNLGRDMSADILHGVFLDIVVHSADNEIAGYSKACIRQSMDIADRMGIYGVVFHTGLIAGFKDDFYVNNWLEKNEKFYREICQEFPKRNVYLENMFELDCELLVELARRMADVKNFGICLDYAHAKLSAQMGNEWITSCAPYMHHMHINDNDLKQDQHKTLGTGKINWEKWKQEMQEAWYPKDFSILIEVRSLESFEESMQYLEKLYEGTYES